MDEIIDRANRLGARFASVRHEASSTFAMRINDGIMRIDSNSNSDGYMIRVLGKRGYAYKSTTKVPSASDIESMLAMCDTGKKEVISEIPPKHDSVKPEQKKSMDKSNEEKAADIRRLYNEMSKLDKRIKTISVIYSESITKKQYINTYGRDITQEIPYCSLVVTMVLKEGNNSASVAVPYRTVKGYLPDMVPLERIVEKTKRQIDCQMNGTAVKAGEYPVMLAPGAVGVFSHEAIGHLAEYDLAEKGSLSKIKGKRIAIPQVSISDAPYIDSDSMFGYAKYDDEGVEGTVVHIIERGVVKGFMNNLRYAKQSGDAPTGNARAQGFSYPEIIRMRNTYMESGLSSKEDMMSEIKKGYLITKTTGGETSSDGSFQFGIGEGYLIENGEVKQGLKLGAGISGYTLETLANIDDVSKDFDADSGFCGKNGQWVPVSDGGPYIRLKKLKVG